MYRSKPQIIALILITIISAVMMTSCSSETENSEKNEEQAVVSKGRLAKMSRLASEELGDSILLGVEDTLDMFDDEEQASKNANKLRGALLILIIQYCRDILYSDI